jgi:hypothetical protein
VGIACRTFCCAASVCRAVNISFFIVTWSTFHPSHVFSAYLEADSCVMTTWAPFCESLLHVIGIFITVWGLYWNSFSPSIRSSQLHLVNSGSWVFGTATALRCWEFWFILDIFWTSLSCGSHCTIYQCSGMVPDFYCESNLWFHQINH